MEIIIVKDAEQACQRAADIIESTIWQKLDAVLGFATGSSPLPVYQALGQRGLDFSGASGFALDEYVDIPLEHPQRYAAIIRREVVDVLALNEQLVHVPDGRALDLDMSAQQYDRAIREAGGIDTQLLGIGAKGVSILVLLEAGDHEMLWPGVARTPKSPAGQQSRVPKWKPPFGANGHIGFNEPTSSFASRAQRKP